MHARSPNGGGRRRIPSGSARPQRQGQIQMVQGQLLAATAEKRAAEIRREFTQQLICFERGKLRRTERPKFSQNEFKRH